VVGNIGNPGACSPGKCVKIEFEMEQHRGMILAHYRLGSVHENTQTRSINPNQIADINFCHHVVSSLFSNRSRLHRVAGACIDNQ